VLFFEIFQADLKMKFSGAGDDVFSCIGEGDEDCRIGFGETFETFDESGKWEGRQC